MCVWNYHNEISFIINYDNSKKYFLNLVDSRFTMVLSTYSINYYIIIINRIMTV
jgi:hypothetical protein